MSEAREQITKREANQKFRELTAGWGDRKRAELMIKVSRSTAEELQKMLLDQFGLDCEVK